MRRQPKEERLPHSSAPHVVPPTRGATSVAPLAPPLVAHPPFGAAQIAAPPRIALDAMGSDAHPVPEILGALDASRMLGIEVLLVGDENVLRPELDRLGASGRVEIRHAAEAVRMDDDPTEALRRNFRSSMRIAVDAVRRGEASAAVSAGNSGALLFTAVGALGRITGVERPAIAVELPSLGEPVLLADAGANVSCRPSHLVAFAHLAATAVAAMRGKPRPSVGLLSNGAERCKGTDLTRRVLASLEASGLDFSGYVEPNEVIHGRTDIVVTDGFSGNLFLKTMEGTGHLAATLLRRSMSDGLRPWLGHLLARRAMKRHLGATLDYEERGGAPLLGVGGLVVAAHGRSGRRAIRNALALAVQLARLDLPARLRERFATLSVASLETAVSS